MLSSPLSNFLAMILFAASVGWYASQNTYLDRSSHKTELVFALGPLKQINGGKYPPQHGSPALTNPRNVPIQSAQKKKFRGSINSKKIKVLS